MRARTLAALPLALALLSGCYRQVVQTGRTPSNTIITRPWTHTYLWGLVAAQPIDVTSQCRSGIATVVTEQSVLNGLVMALTLGIWAPRQVTVTCAIGTARHDIRPRGRPGTARLVAKSTR